MCFQAAALQRASAEVAALISDDCADSGAAHVVTSAAELRGVRDKARSNVAMTAVNPPEPEHL